MLCREQAVREGQVQVLDVPQHRGVVRGEAGGGAVHPQPQRQRVLHEIYGHGKGERQAQARLPMPQIRVP